MLSEADGIPFIGYYYFDYDYQDGESMNVMMARAEDKMEDMFFMGGDANNQGFTAWKRID